VRLLDVLLPVLTCCQALAQAAAPTEGVPFDGKTTYAAVEDGAPFDLAAFTLACRVRLRQTGDSQIFLNRGEPGTLFTLYLYKGRVRMLVQYAGGRNYTHANVAAPPADTWVHYAGTYDGEQIRIFVNGKLAGTTAAKGRIPRSKAPLYIGCVVPGERVLDGWMDDARVWRRVLSPAEIAAAATGKDVPDGLVGRWTRASLDGEHWANTAAAGLAAVYKANPKVTPRRRPTVDRAPAELLNTKDDGYRGIWYCNQRQDNEYVYKYSGGLGTYCAKHIPFAVYARAARKTFFCYGGRPKERNILLHMVSCYDHDTGTVPRPTILLNKGTDDAHDNPVIQLDERGHIWIFSSAHGTGRPAYISVSKRPYDIDDFELVLTDNYSYPQPHYLPGKGFFFLHTKYGGGRRLYFSTSPDGRTWTDPTLIARIGQGHYQISGRSGDKVATTFNYHPQPRGLNWRTNLYYMETTDFGKTWRNAAGEPITLPLTTPSNPALVHDYAVEKRNVYLKDIAFDAQGRPVILYVTSGGWEAGPKNDPRIWTVARWTGETWDIRGQITSDNNYDSGSLYIERPDLWRLIAPTQTGPQPYNPGGEVAMWTTADQGKTWKLVRQLTRNSPRNHTYCRKPVNPQPAFYALWADGHARKPSESRLYFCDQQGNVYLLPPEMKGDTAKPIQLKPEDF